MDISIHIPTPTEIINKIFGDTCWHCGKRKRRDELFINAQHSTLEGDTYVSDVKCWSCIGKPTMEKSPQKFRKKIFY